MVLLICTVTIVLAFIFSYNLFKDNKYDTEKERVKSMQVFALSWALVAVVAVALYFAFCLFTGEPPFYRI